jgi:ubiquitin-conjugating enzyme E2 D/E
MKARSHIDCDKTREDVSKMLFHTLIDKLLSLELSHALSLVAFGERIISFGVVKDYERFHDELGRLDANEGSTKLYDSICSAAEVIEAYALEQGLNIPKCSDKEPVRKRVFVLTDGEDNGSKRNAWEAAQFLQVRNIHLDAIPLQSNSKTLQRMCIATGGLCFDVVSLEQCMDLFERESTLHVSFREAPVNSPPSVTSHSEFETIKTSDAPKAEICSAVPKSLFSPCLVASVVQQKAEVASTSTSTPASLKRVMREYVEFNKTPVKGAQIFMSADNSYLWKAVLTDLPGVFSGGAWLITIEFPRNYPFSAPSVRFYTPIYHCNVSVDGHICLDTLINWSPGFTIIKCLTDIRHLIENPDPNNNPLDSFKASVYRDYVVNGDPAYLKLAKEHTQTAAGESVASLISKYNLE